MSWETRLLFIGLWSYVDDNGVGRDVDSLIASNLFPFDLSRDSRECLARVANGLQSLSDGGQIVRYFVDQKPLLFIKGWDEYQKVDRPNKERYPRPTSTNAKIRDTLATPSRDSRDTLAPGEGEKGRRGVVKNTPSSADADGAFEAFWSAYPRKVDKGHARTAYQAARKKADPDVILAGVQRYALSVANSEAKFVAHARTWLNGERWNDTTTTRPRVVGGTQWEQEYS